MPVAVTDKSTLRMQRGRSCGAGKISATWRMAERTSSMSLPSCRAASELTREPVVKLKGPPLSCHSAIGRFGASATTRAATGDAAGVPTLRGCAGFCPDESSGCVQPAAHTRLSVAAKTARIMSADANGPDAAAERRHVEPAVRADVAQPGHRSIGQAVADEIPPHVPDGAGEDTDVAGDVQPGADDHHVVDRGLRQVAADVTPRRAAVTCLEQVRRPVALPEAAVADVDVVRRCRVDRHVADPLDRQLRRAD